MNKTSIGHKLQSLAKVVLIAGLIQGIFIVGFLLTALWQSTGAHSENVGLSINVGLSMAGISTFTGGAIWNILLPFISFYCIKGFGQLLINSDEMVKLQAEGLKVQKAVLNTCKGKNEQE